MKLMLAAALAALGLHDIAAAQPAWTWTLYQDDGAVVLANEAPDTPNLRATLQCEARSGVVEVTVYDEQARPASSGFARLNAGSASTAGQARLGRNGRLDVTVRTDHPVFAAFVASGELEIRTGGRLDRVSIARPHLAKLRRLADLCAG